MEKQLRLDGSVDLPSTITVLERNADDSLPSKYRKAIKWFVEDNALALVATNAWPIYHFTTEDGQDVTHHIGEIVQAYQAHKKISSKKGQTAA